MSIQRSFPLGSGGGGAVDSVNGETGAVTLTAADVGADASGTATSALSSHTGASDPHSQYLTTAEGNAAYQALDSDLTTIAALAPANNDFLQRKAGAWANRTVAEVIADLGIDFINQRLNALDGISNVGNIGSSQTLTAGSNNGTVKLVTLTAANCTFTFNPGASGFVSTLELVITQDATGGRTVTWPASVKWANGTPPVLSTAANAVDRFIITTYNNGTTWYGDIVGKGYA